MIDDRATTAVTVIAHYQSHPGAGDEVAAILARHVNATRAEPGCIGFSAYRDEADPDRFALHEEYASEQAFQERPTVVLETGGLRLVTDPTFDEPRTYPLAAGQVLSKTAGPACQPAGIGPADAVLLSHDQHPDNLDLAGNCRELGPWQRLDLPRPDGGTLRVTRTPAEHGPDGTGHLTGDVAGRVRPG